MRVVLVLPGSGFRSSSPTSLAGGEHLGLGSIAAYLRKFGHEVVILNFQVEDSLFAAPHTAADVTERILKHEPDVVGMSITGLTISQALVVTEDIKKRKPSLHVCWGSHQAASCAEEILQNEQCVDTIVAGDGEIPMLKLITALEKGEPLSTVPGLWYREVTAASDTVLPTVQIKLTSKPPEPEIDEFPFPARDTLEELLRRNVKITDARIYTSRGCPFRCTFCVYPALTYLKKWRDRSPEKIVEEIKLLNQKYGITHFWFSDDNFTLPTIRGRMRAQELAEALIAENLGITYRVLMRADAVDGQDKLLDSLARSGLTCVYMGIESGSPRRLTYLDKHANPDVYSRAIKAVKKTGIGLQIGFIMFDPMTSWEDLEIDARFLHDTKEMYLYTNYAQVLYAYPGTPVAKQLIDKGLLPKDFNYRSGYREYEYEDPKIGKLAELLHGANTKERVEIDDFFRRLRMIDVPGLFRNGYKDAVAINTAVEEKLIEQNEKGFELFMRLLEITRAGRDYTTAAQLVQGHFREALRSMEGLVGTLKRFPDAADKLSALKYLYTGTRDHESLSKRAEIDPSVLLANLSTSAGVAEDCA